MDLLRLVTAGNVDDGKSTLIGRLLYDSKLLHADQIAALQRASRASGSEELNLALITDGLKAEREQGITIDVAYRYFATPKRKFIMADSPGHFQYTRNMVTAISNGHLAILLVDASRGFTEQTYRHCLISSLFGIRHLVICVNKMDLVDWSEETFRKICGQYQDFSKKLEIYDVTLIPMSALRGDNVVERSTKMAWYNGRSLLEHLEEAHTASDANSIDFRMPVQMVIRHATPESGEYRGLAGSIVSGGLREGDAVTVLPSGFTSRVKSIQIGEKALKEASAPMSVTVRLEDEIDVSRGDLLVRTQNQPLVSQDLEVMICWMDKKPLSSGNKYLMLQTTNQSRCVIQDFHYKIDINTLHRIQDQKSLELNDIGKLSIRTAKPIVFDPYRRNRSTGSFVLVDEATFATVGAGFILE